MLKADKISIAYGDLRIVKDVSIKLEGNETVAILGSNGAGKTTLLNGISGLLKLSEGEICYNGERIDKCQPHEIVKRGIIQVPEGRKIFPSLTVKENLEMGSYLTRKNEKIKFALDEVYGLFPMLKERRRQVAGTLSGGQQQMLAIGRGLMSLPKILILDEPSLGLAPLVVDEIFRVIKKINMSGISVMISEQNIENTLQLAQRAYVLENGCVVLEGSGKDLLEDKHVKKAYLGL